MATTFKNDSIITTTGPHGTISAIDVKGTHYSIDLAQSIKDNLYIEFLKKLSRAPIIEHKCHSCGGVVEMDERKHVFICPYCGCSYAVGVFMVNDRG